MATHDTTQRLAAGRVFADLRVHAFTDAPAIALCDAGVLMARTAGLFEPDDLDSDVCRMCVDILRRQERTLRQPE